MQKYSSRKRNRKQDFDYSSSGIYVVTICVEKREYFFGDIKNNKIVLNDLGKIVWHGLYWLENNFDYLEINEEIVMPNHIHFILIINNPDKFGLFMTDKHFEMYNRSRSDRSRPVGVENANNPLIVGNGNTRSDRSPLVGNQNGINQTLRTDSSRAVATGVKKIKSLSELVGAFKTITSKKIHKIGREDFKWQRSFYDQIIRNEKMFFNIKEYIRNNPINWQDDINNLKNKNNKL
ncbi:MAG: hypothetical protein ABIF17_00520 [Patescibacteria group bacterium]